MALKNNWVNGDTFTPAAANDMADAINATNLPLRIDVNSAPYNVTPSTTNPEVAIQQALDYAAANGIPEVVISKPGTYTIGALYRVAGQVNGQVYAALWGYSNLKLTMKPGVVLKLKNNIAYPAAATSCQFISVNYPYASTSGGTKTNWSIEGGVIDGNAANQSSLVLGVAVFLGACRNSWVKDVVVKNVWGSASGPPGETFHFDANYCADVAFINCVADGSGSANTATGFSANNAFGVAWTGCTALGMGFGMGFTAWQSAEMQYANCRSYSNVVGFNIERSQYVTYTGCVAGGGSPTLNAGATANQFFPGGQTDLGNVTGFKIQGCSDLVVNGSVISENTINIEVITNGADHRVCQRVLFNGCLISGSSAPAQIESVATGGYEQVNVHFHGCSVFDGTITGANYLNILTANPYGTPGIYASGGTNTGLNLGTKGTGKIFMSVETGQTPTLQAAGVDTNLDLNVTAKGTGVVNINNVAQFNPLGSNYVNIISSNGTPGIYAVGSTNTGLNLGTKGTGSVFITVETGQTATLSAAGSDTNHNLNLSGKGSGVVNINGSAALYSGGALGTPSSGTLSSCSGLPVSGITSSTSTALGLGSIELGHATDCTVTRSAAGVIAVEGFTVMTKVVVSVTGTQTLSAVDGREYIVLLKSGAVPTLPTAVSNTSIYQVKNTHTDSISLATTSSQTIEGTSLTIKPGESFTLVSDNANWVII